MGRYEDTHNQVTRSTQGWEIIFDNGWTMSRVYNFADDSSLCRHQPSKVRVCRKSSTASINHNGS